MGCITSKKPGLSTEENLIKSIIQNWNLSEFSSVSLVSCLKSEEDSSNITYNSLKNSIKSLGIHQRHCFEFLKYFTRKAPISIKKVQTLLILAGKSKLKEKIKLLFKFYAETRPRFLLKSEAELMVSHILLIQLTSVPGYCSFVMNDEVELQNYYFKMSLFTNSLLKYFIGKMMNNELDLTFKEMLSAFWKHEELQFLLKGRKLRSFCFEVFSKQGKITPLQSPKHLRSKSTPQSFQLSEDDYFNLSIS
jgi:hypothetical protein